MNTKITLIYDNPADPGAFEAGYPDQLALAKTIPGIQKLETSKVWPKEDGERHPGVPPGRPLLPRLRRRERSRGQPGGRAFFPGVFELATGGVRIVFADVEETETPNTTHGGRDDHHATPQ